MISYNQTSKIFLTENKCIIYDSISFLSLFLPDTRKDKERVLWALDSVISDIVSMSLESLVNVISPSEDVNLNRGLKNNQTIVLYKKKRFFRALKGI